MKTDKLYELHTKQCNIIDLIKRTDQRQQDWQEMLSKEHYRIVFGTNYLNRKIRFHEAVKNRLINYYIKEQVNIMILQPELNTSTEMDLATELS